MSQEEQHATEATEVVTKLLGAHVDEELYWKFKAVAAQRNERLQDAIKHAANMYIGAGGE